MYKIAKPTIDICLYHAMRAPAGVSLYLFPSLRLRKTILDVFPLVLVTQSTPFLVRVTK